MLNNMCTHMGDTITDWKEISSVLKANQQNISCSDCNCHGPNLWLCLKKSCGHIGCSEKSNDHNTIHNANNVTHSIHLNLSTERVWCYDCRTEIFLPKKTNYINGYESDQEDPTKINNDSGHGSYATLRANSPDRGAIFENSVGLNVGMNGDGDVSDSSDVGESGDFTVDTSNKGLVGLQNIGNTCYMNAALQALSNTEPLTRYFIDCEKIVYMLSEGKKPGLSRTYQTLIRDMWVKKNPHTFVTPSGILYGIRNVHAMFRGYHQHDTQEFLRNFMDQLHEELKQPEVANLNEADTFSLAVEEPQNTTLNYDSSEGEEYETCDSGVSERSSLSDDSEAQQAGDGRSSGISSAPGSLASKRRLSRCQSPGRRQRPRVSSQSVIDAQPSINATNQPHQKKQQIKYRSIISDIFDGKLLSSVQCLTCDRVSRRVETFQDLSLPIPSRDHLVVLHGRAALPNATCSDVLVPIQDGWISWIIAWLRSWWYGPMVTLHDCLSAFFSTDELKGDNMYSCEKCNKLRNGIKFSKVLQLPEVLCIHLKRFRHELMYSSKISSAVSFPLKGLDMWPYLHANNISKVSNYDLFSVICHHGTAGGGHYTCYALNGTQWYEFDDQYVNQVSAEKVQNCEAYVLFYRKVQTSAEAVRQKASKIGEQAERQTEVKRVFISKQWITKFDYCVEPGPIDNSDFLCQHGAFDPDKKHELENLAVAIPLEVYEYLHQKFGGCPPIANPVICPACHALQQRMLSEMEMFLEVSKKFEHNPRTHYLSTSWYMQWHSFIQKTSSEPPGPIDNTKIDPNHIDTDEAAEVSKPIWDFFHNIYGGGPTILVNFDSDEEGEQTPPCPAPPPESDPIEKEMGDGPEINGVAEELIETENSEPETKLGECEEVPTSSPPKQNKNHKKGSKYRRRNH
ncbi:ubiquitin carboxyl-terminal hydrolase 20 isoform X2 [Anthonomus grandis grandis]|uniref:ubiquitin carboxyl-terminal hydrolase 20 isoform X2 n=1 Tax=Anthonomus grandis grandis TaxID=2921223 RepID=UPI0021650603|nr:ubiquitin carboxyl-terminal hydrolase 20 isoform X2 [Anthonomus grandis grandis]